MFFLLSLLAVWLLQSSRQFRYRQQLASLDRSQPSGFPLAKPPWVKVEVLRLYEQTGLSHRKLADLFNQLHLANLGLSVGRTYVQNLLKAQAYQALHQQQALKHRVPPPIARNRIWGADTTVVSQGGREHAIVLGIIDHGTRLSVLLRNLRRFNAWTFAGYVLLAIGEYGKPRALRLDNHPVHRSKRFRALMRWAGITLQFTQPASPWQNGRIERFFGTLKAQLKGFVIDRQHCDQTMETFRFWYNTIRTHQHLGGRTPAQVWRGVNPFRTPPKQRLWFEALDGRLKGWVLRH